MLGSISSWVMLHDLTTTVTKGTTTFIWITLHNMGKHGLIDSIGNMYYETCIYSMNYHNSFASNSSSSLLMSRVHRSSLRYFQPPSARMTTILPLSIFSATRIAACKAAPQDGPAKIPS